MQFKWAVYGALGQLLCKLWGFIYGNKWEWAEIYFMHIRETYGLICYAMGSISGNTCKWAEIYSLQIRETFPESQC